MQIILKSPKYFLRALQVFYKKMLYIIIFFYVGKHELIKHVLHLKLIKSIGREDQKFQLHEFSFYVVINM